MRRFINMKKKKVESFLAPKEIQTRQCVYISREVHQKIAQMVHLLSNGRTTIGGYIDNVLLEHLSEHRDEINALYHKQVENLL